MPKNINILFDRLFYGSVNVNNDALVNAILSFIIPGLGQAINGYKKKAIIMFAIAIILAVIIYMSKVGQIGHAVSIIYQLYAAYDAYNTY